MELTKLSLFSGILGDDLASEWAGIKTICCVEIDPFCQQVIKKHHPNMPIIGDVRDVTKERIKESPNIISGGFPCQDVSTAGLRQGINEDTRSGLWGEYARIIGEFRPSWVVAENVRGLLSVDDGGDLEEYSGTFPTWGIMWDGACYELPLMERNIKESEYSSLPTPTATDGLRCQFKKESINKSLAKGSSMTLIYLIIFKDLLQYAPVIYEQLMGFPPQWTQLENE